MPEVEIERVGRVATVTLNRPDKLNSLTTPMWRALVDAFVDLDADPDTGAVVVGGAGEHFCAGADINDLQRHHKSGEVVAAEEAIASCRKPVIASLHGYCLGGGLLLAAACDVRIAASDCRFGLPPAKMGIVYPEAATRRFVSLVGPAATKFLIFTAERIGAERALRIGLVDEVVDAAAVADRALQLATEIASLSRLTTLATKEIVNAMTLGRPTRDLVARWVETADSGPDIIEGMEAFAARRTPTFRWTPPTEPGQP